MGLGFGVGVGVGEGVGDSVGAGEGDGVGDGVGDGLGVGVSGAVLAGCGAVAVMGGSVGEASGAAMPRQAASAMALSATASNKLNVRRT